MEETTLEVLRNILKAPDLAFAAIFGSRARGAGRPESDLDLALWPLRPLELREELDLAARLTLAAGAEVDLVNLHSASVLLRYNVAREGILVAENVPGSWARFRAEAIVDYLDFEPTFTHASRAYAERLALGPV